MISILSGQGTIHWKEFPEPKKKSAAIGLKKTDKRQTHRLLGRRHLAIGIPVGR